MVAKSTSTKRERLEARITPEQKAQFQRAVDLADRTLTDFIVEAVRIAAEETIQAREAVRLSPRDYELFVETCLNPRGANDEIRALADRYQAFAGE